MAKKKKLGDTEAEKKARPGVEGVLQDSGQAVIAALVSADAAAMIPGIRHVVAVGKGVEAIRSAILMRKIERFIEAFADVSLVDRMLLTQKLEADPGYRRKVGEHVLEYLDRIDSKRKPFMGGLVFAAYVQGEINVKQLLRLLAAIEKVPSIEVDALRPLVETAPGLAWEKAERETKNNLSNAGLLDNRMTFDGNMWDLNDTARLFIKLELDRKTADE